MVTRSKTTHWVVFELRSTPVYMDSSKKEHPTRGVIFWWIRPVTAHCHGMGDMDMVGKAELKSLLFLIFNASA